MFIMEATVAFGAADEENLSRTHFGESPVFIIKSLDLETGEWRDIRKIKNTSAEEHFHGDPGKAMSISQILEDCNVLVAFAMGPNITRMRRKFVPVISRITAIPKIMAKLSSSGKEIKASMEKELKDVIYIQGPVV